jgi:hypothetical protein
MENKPESTLTLEDLAPMESELTLSSRPEKTYHLKKFTLKDRLHFSRKYGAEKVQEAFAKLEFEVLADFAWHLLKEKDAFENSFDVFTEAVESVKDIYNVTTALLTCVGISEPVIKAMQSDPKLLAQLTGQKSPS